MQKYRVYELAKMFGKTNEEVIRTLQKNNVNVKTNFNSVGEKEKTFWKRHSVGKNREKIPIEPSGPFVLTDREDRQGERQMNLITVPTLPTR